MAKLSSVNKNERRKKLVKQTAPKLARLKEQIVFPEINYDQIDKVRGMDVIITTTAKTDEEARELLRLFNFPFPAEAEKAAA